MGPPVPSGFSTFDRATAVQRYSDQRNLAVLYAVAALLGLEVVTAILTGRSRNEGGWFALAFGAAILTILIVRFAAKLRRSPNEWKPRGRLEARILERLDRSLRTFVISTYLGVSAIIAVRWMFRTDDQPLIVVILIAIALRVTFSERLMMHLALLLCATGVTMLRPGLNAGSLVGYAVVTVVALLVGWLLNRGFVRTFLRAWEPEQKRVREEMRMREELDLARTIQLSMLPSSIPTVRGLSLDAQSIPATEVGGDFYDFFERDGRFAVVAADVAGHGVGSGIVLSGVRTALRLLSEDLDRPESMFERLEAIIRETRTERMLVTLCLVSFDPDRRDATVISAGHPPVIHWRADTRSCETILLPSLPLGTRLTQTSRSKRISLASGDRILVHSDGAYESRDRGGNEYGLERLCARLAEADEREAPAATLQRIVGRLEEFREGTPQEDDVTLICVRVE